MATKTAPQPAAPAQAAIRTPQQDQELLNNSLNQQLSQTLQGEQVDTTPVTAETEVDVKAGDPWSEKIDRIGLLHNPRAGQEPSKTLKGMMAAKMAKVKNKITSRTKDLDPNL